MTRRGLLSKAAALVATAVVCSETSSQQCREAFTLYQPGSPTYTWFGSSLAFDGDTLLVGSALDRSGDQQPGSAKVFRRTGSLSFEFEATLLSPEVEGWRPMTGVSVALDGDLAVVGSPGCTVGDHLREGKVFVFRRGPNGLWEQEATLIHPDGSGYDGFGWSVAVKSDMIVVGVPGDSVKGPGGYTAWPYIGVRQGSSHVFTRNKGAGWVHASTLTTGETDTNQAFGAALALSDDWLAVSAPWRDVAPDRGGRVFLYRRIGGWLGSPTVIEAPDTDNGVDLFGYSLAIDGERLVVGEWGSPSASGPIVGRGHVFESIGYQWSHKAVLMPTHPINDYNRFYGVKVALDGDLAIVGTNGSFDGQAFERHPNGLWAPSFVLRRVSVTVGNLYLGNPLVILSDLILAGNQNVPGYSGRGGVSVYFRDDQSPDADSDGLADLCDNCPETFNPQQSDCDNDRIGDACEILLPDGDCNADSIPDDCQPQLADCDTDGVPDMCEIAAGAESDLNNDGVPDRCQCIADVNGSGAVDAVDLAVILTRWGGDPAQYPNADIDRDGIIGSSDLSIVLAGWGPCPD